MEKIIGLRGGHIGATKSTGASANGLNERDINQNVYNYVYHRLKSYGFNIINKTGEIGSSVYNHYNKYLPSNKYLLLSIHHDGNPNVGVNGSMVLASVFATSKCITNAKYLLNEFLKAFDSKNRGIYQRKNESEKDYYGIIRETKASVILGEALVLTNKANADYIKKNYDYFITSQGESYVKTACNWYDIDYNFKVSETPNNLNEYDKRFEFLENEINNLKKLVTQQNKTIQDYRIEITKCIEQVKNIQKPEKYDKVLKLIDWIDSYK